MHRLQWRCWLIIMVKISDRHWSGGGERKKHGEWSGIGSQKGPEGYGKSLERPRHDATIDQSFSACHSYCLNREIDGYSTEMANKDGTWLREICSCCSLTTAGKTRQLLLNKINIPFLPSLYNLCEFKLHYCTLILLQQWMATLKAHSSTRVVLDSASFPPSAVLLAWKRSLLDQSR